MGLKFINIDGDDWRSLSSVPGVLLPPENVCRCVSEKCKNHLYVCQLGQKKLNMPKKLISNDIHSATNYFILIHHIHI